MKNNKPKNEHAQALVRERWKNTTPEERSKYAKMLNKESVKARRAKKALKNKG